MKDLSGKIQPSGFFVIVAIISQLVLTCVRPPFQSPDEFPHFCRAYQISEGNFLPEVIDKRVGGNLPVCLKDYYSDYSPSTCIQDYKMRPSQFLGSSGVECSDSSRVFIDFPNTGTYSFIAYLPQSAALFMLRMMNCSIEVQYYGSKFFSFLVYLVCMFFVIKHIPLYKWLLTLVFLLPMNLYMLNSFSGDIMTNALVFLLLSRILKCKFSENKISIADLGFIFTVGILLAFTKVVYTSLLLILITIPAQRFISGKQRFAVLFLFISVPFLLACIWAKLIMGYYPAYSDYNENYRMHVTLIPLADAHKQIEHLMTHKTHFFKVLHSSLTTNPEFYLRSYVGHFGTYMDTPVPDWLYVSAFIILLLVAVFEANEVRFSLSDRLVFILTALVMYSLIILSLHLVWNEVGAETFPVFQGRYLVPVLPLVYMTLNIPVKSLMAPLKFCVMFFVIIVNLFVFNILYQRYLKETFISEFIAEGNADVSDAEKSGTLKLGAQRSQLERRSGKYSVMISSDTIKAFVFDFKGLKQNDMVELTGWFKGNGGCVGVSGSGKDCNPFRYLNNEVLLTDKKGWKKLRMIFYLPMKCDSNQVSFFATTSGNEPVFFDDVRYRVKRFE